MGRDEHLIDSLIRKILRGDTSPELKQDSLDLLTKLAGDGSRSARSLVRRLQFDAVSSRWRLRSADEIHNSHGHRPQKRQRMTN